jgi:hypothetical protein
MYYIRERIKWLHLHLKAGCTGHNSQSQWSTLHSAVAVCQFAETALHANAGGSFLLQASRMVTITAGNFLLQKFEKKKQF